MLGELGLSDPQALAERIRSRIALASSGGLIVHRDIEGVGKKVDVGKYLIEAHPGEGGEILTSAGIGGTLVPIALKIAVTGEGTAKAIEVVEALLGQKDAPVRIVRAALLAKDGLTPFDLSAIRPPRRATAQREEAGEVGPSEGAS